MLNLLDKKFISISLIVGLLIIIISTTYKISTAKNKEKQKCVELLTANNLKANNIKSNIHYRTLTSPAAWNKYFQATKTAEHPYETLVIALQSYQKKK